MIDVKELIFKAHIINTEIESQLLLGNSLWTTIESLREELEYEKLKNDAYRKLCSAEEYLDQMYYKESKNKSWDETKDKYFAKTSATDILYDAEVELKHQQESCIREVRQKYSNM